MSPKFIRNILSICTRVDSLRSFQLFAKMPFYAVAKGRTPGIFMSWTDCEFQVKGFSGARYKKFNTVVEAQEYISIHGDRNSNKSLTAKASNANTINKSTVKRPYSCTKKENTTSDLVPQKKLRQNQKVGTDLNFEDFDAEDLNDELNKQMDDIEKRLKGIERNVNRITKNNSVATNSNKRTILIEPPQNKKMPVHKLGFEVSEDGYVQVYTDGACSDNGKSTARAGLGVYWGDDHPLNTSEPVSGRATNNCGEIQAATCAIQQALQNGITHLAINTDSQFLINSVTKWMPAWKRKGWKLRSGEPVKNVIDFKELDAVKDKLNVKWNYVTAHNGVYGNEMADRLAKEGAAMYSH